MIGRFRSSLASWLCLLVACAMLFVVVTGGAALASVSLPHEAGAGAHAHDMAIASGGAVTWPEDGRHCSPGPDCGPQIFVAPGEARVARHAAGARLGRAFRLAMNGTILSFELPPPRPSRV